LVDELEREIRQRIARRKQGEQAGKIIPIKDIR